MIWNGLPGSVGTRGGVGWRWGPCACPRAGTVLSAFSDGQRPALPTPDKHKAPTSTPLIPLSLQEARLPPITLFVRQKSSGCEAPPPLLPRSVVTVHQDGYDSLPLLGWQTLSGRDQSRPYTSASL